MSEKGCLVILRIVGPFSGEGTPISEAGYGLGLVFLGLSIASGLAAKRFLKGTVGNESAPSYPRKSPYFGFGATLFAVAFGAISMYIFINNALAPQ